MGARTATYSGSYWSYETSSRTLRITGDIPWMVYDESPWINFDVSKVIISSSVKKIGAWAFAFKRIEELYIEDCQEPLRIALPYDNCSSCDYWDEKSVFEDCPLKTIYLGRTCIGIDYYYQDQHKNPLVEVGKGNSNTHVANVTSVTFGQYTTQSDFKIINSYPNLQSVSVNNPNYVLVNDILYNADKTILMRAMPYKTSDYFVVPSTVTKIEDAFMNCPSISIINIPNSVESIGYNAFNGCSGLISINIPAKIKEVTSNMFAGCNNLEQITVDASNTTYDSRDNCNAIIQTNTNTLIVGCSNTIIPNTVQKIGSRAFLECKRLTTINIPSSVLEIEAGGFEGCSNMSNISIPNSVTIIGGAAFSGCQKLSDIVLPSSINKIGEYAFFDCYSLSNIEIPEGVTEIGQSTFSKCTQLKSVVIPSTVTKIGDYAFYNCISLNDVYVKNTKPVSAWYGFSVDDEKYDEDYIHKAILHVPYGTKSIYAAAGNPWQYFGTIVEMEPEDILCTSIELNNPTAGLKVGETLTLSATILPETATDKTVTWTSSNPSVATVSNGVVTTVTVGTTTITAETTDGSGLKATCTVTVKRDVTSITISPTSESIYIGDNVTLTATVNPSDATNKELTWTSSNPSAATVDNGVVTGVGTGTTTITATAKDGSGVSSSCEITVSPVVTENVAFDIKSKEIHQNESFTITPAFTPGNVSNKNLTWNSDDETVATVANGVVTGIGLGTATITATTLEGSGLSAQCEVTVTPVPNSLYALSQKAPLSHKVTLPIYMSNEVTMCGYEFYLSLPEGITVDYSYDEDEEEYTFGARNGERARTSHVLSCSKRADGTYYFFCYDPSNKNFYDSEEKKDLPLLYVTLNVPDDIELGQHAFVLKNVILNHNTDEDEIEEYKPADFTATLTAVRLHSVSTSVNDASFGSIAVSGDTYDGEECTAEDGSEVTLTALPADKYRFVNWTENGSFLSDANPLVITLTEDRTLTAVFERSQSNVTFMVDGDTYSTGRQNCGDVITLPAEPVKTGYVFLYWDGIGEDGLVPEDDVTYTAVFTMLGDIREDQKVNITDLTSLVNYLKSGTVPEDVRTMKAADLTKDGKLNITDLTSLVNVMKSGLMGQPVMKSLNRSAFTAELRADDVTTPAGSSFDMDIVLRNGSDRIANMQFDVVLPEGIHFASDGKASVMQSQRTRTHSIAVGNPDENTSRIILYTADNSDISGEDGSIVTLRLTADSRCIGRLNEIQIRDIVMSRADETSIETGRVTAMISVTNATGIDSLSSDMTAGEIYDLSGIRTDNVQKNRINIINGKKTLIK